MRHKKAMLFGAALAAMPIAASHGATISYYYYSVLFGTTSTSVTSAAGVIAGTAVVYTGGGSNYGTNAAVTVPVGDYVSFGVEASVTGNGGSGLEAFALGINNSNPASSVIYTSAPTAGTVLPANSKSTINSDFNLSTYAGNYDGVGGIQATGGGAIGGVANAPSATNAQSVYGVSAPGGLFSKLKISSLASGVTTYTPIQIPGSTAFFTQNSLGASPSAVTSYSNRKFNAATDTVSAMPTLVITSVGLGSSSSSASKHAIVSLAPGGTGTYGAQLGSITVTSTGHPGSYVPGSTAFGAATTGYVVTSTFNPATDTEIYAIKLQYNGGSGEVAIPTASALNGTIAADINALGTGSNVSAGTVSGSAYASLFPGYDILLTSTTAYSAFATGTDDLDVDFSQDTDTATPGLVVVGAAAVPEPATAAGVVLGAAGLLLGRRKSKILA